MSILAVDAIAGTGTIPKFIIERRGDRLILVDAIYLVL
jgi:hypothetical protein